MINENTEMQVWYVSSDVEGETKRVAFGDCDEMLEHAHEVLDILFDRLGEDGEKDRETLTIEQSKMTRGQWLAITERKGGHNE